MHCKTICAAIIACLAANVLAVPVPQLAGEGAACDSVLSSTDNGVGYGVENAEDVSDSALLRPVLTSTEYCQDHLVNQTTACWRGSSL